LERDAVKRILDIPGEFEIPVLVLVGFPDEEPAPRLRGNLKTEIRYYWLNLDTGRMTRAMR